MIPGIVAGTPASPPGPDPWTPADIATELWLDAADAATIIESGGAVSQWNDKSGNDRHAVQATAMNRPVVSAAAINGLDAVHFDGNNDRLSIADFPTGETSYSIYAVLKNDQDPPGNAIQTGIWNFTSDTTATASSHHPFTDSNLYHNFGSSTRKPLGNPTPSLTGAHLFNVDSASSSWQARLNGTQLFTTATNTVGMQATCHIGMSDPVAANRFYDGHFAEIVVCAAVLSQSTREKMEGYLAWKWSITLPPGHPYEDTPP